jgi:hypothetical protein
MNRKQVKLLGAHETDYRGSYTEANGTNPDADYPTPCGKVATKTASMYSMYLSFQGDKVLQKNRFAALLCLLIYITNGLTIPHRAAKSPQKLQVCTVCTYLFKGLRCCKKIALLPSSVC